MTPEQKLIALMQAQTPPLHDPLFEIGVQEKLARHRAFERFSRMSMAVVVLSGLTAALGWAVVQGQASASLPILTAVGASAMAGLVVWTVGRA